MKSIILFTVVSLLLTGCSYTQFLPATATIPVPTATATIYSTPASTATITPTQPTPTFTNTPTLVYLNGSPTPSEIPLGTSTLYVIPSITPTDTIAPLLVPDGPFARVLLSGNKIFWGACEPTSVLVTVHVVDSVPAKKVLMFLRLEETRAGGNSTEWGGGADMDSQGHGDFTYQLTAKSFSHYNEFTSAWGQYQFVAFDANLGRLGASKQYISDLTISACP
jgi:hypothetical protein